MNASVPRHLVVASDFGPASDQALLRAAGLAQRHDARLSLLHVIEPLPVISAWGDPGAAAWLGIDALLAAGEKALREQLERHPGWIADHASLHCRIGQPRRDLGTLAFELGGELLVLGARDQRRIGDRLLGSTAQAAVHGSPLPVLVVRRPAASPWSPLLVATDFSPAATRALELAEHLVESGDRRLLHVHTPLPEATVALMQPEAVPFEAYRNADERDAAQRFDALCAEHPGWIGEFRRGSAIEVLLAEVEARAAALVVLGTRGHGPWIGGLLGSVGQAMLARSHSDVLLVPEPQSR